METVEYNVIVDGEVIDEITLPKNTIQRDKDKERQRIANDLVIPIHYLHLRPKRHITDEKAWG